MRSVFLMAALLWPALAADLPRGTIGPDDTVTITALNVEEISKAWRVGPSGELNLPMIGRLKAAGLTADQLEAEIATRLKKFVVDPQVTVFVSDFKSHPVTVSGAVERPGVLQLEKPTPLFAVLAQAGGVKDAGPTVTLTRPIENGPIPVAGARDSKDGKYSILELPVEAVLRGNGEDANVEVRPFDSITVSTVKRPRLVYMAGEFNKPGAIELDTMDTVSLSKAIALAGGITHVAKPGRTLIRHIGANGQETAVAFVDIRKILDGKAKDLVLSDGDVVIVPSSSLSTYIQAMGTTAITSSVMILARL
ncbi:MAG TPA: polysaccharide biosynthesis/export family protein [Bryobacteraceae bacterium]|nr:polysaccharide biosynthesis/export family protein [Bryobacteraceae bacterium]